jgi:hypothetical protein
VAFVLLKQGKVKFCIFCDLLALVDDLVEKGSFGHEVANVWSYLLFNKLLLHLLDLLQLLLRYVRDCLGASIGQLLMQV